MLAPKRRRLALPAVLIFASLLQIGARGCRLDGTAGSVM
jgi:hypothetical protein